MSDQLPPDENTHSRPNPGRKLTENNPQDDELIFYYSRENRLSKAPQRVRDLYEKKPPKFNLLRPLIATRPMAMLFAAVMILSLMSAIIAFSGIADQSYDFEGNSITVAAQKYQGTVIVTIKKEPKPAGEGEPAENTAQVDILISPVQGRAGTEGKAGFSHRLFFGPGKKEEFRLVVPFDSPELVFSMQGENERLEFNLKTR
ncbi:MAG: hypothetical protein LBT39_09640 [Treponema sp.]|nr:hypothetical protein [Treponema sp.]